MNFLENNETLHRKDNIYRKVSGKYVYFGEIFEELGVDKPVMASVSYVSYTSSFLFFIKIIGADTRDKNLAVVIEAAEPLALTRC